MMSYRVALTSLTERVRFEELAYVAAALQRQVSQDFAPAWGISAVVAAFAPESIPAGYYPIFIHDSLGQEGADGLHRTHSDDTPYVVVPYGRNWSLAAGHELLRLLADPSGAARLPGPSCLPGQGIVEYLLDIAAPCRDVSQAYMIDGVVVPDFCLRTFFDERASGSCSFTGALDRPFRPSADGSVAWLADDGLLYQARGGRRKELKIYGGFSCSNRGRLLIRELIDLQTPYILRQLANAPTPANLRQAEQNTKRARLTNLMRFRDDMAWRFGHAVATPDYVVERLATFSSDRDVSGGYPSQQAASEELCTTERTVP